MKIISYYFLYHEVYYLLSGNGRIHIGADEHILMPGAVVTIPAGMPHALSSDSGDPLEFILFGTPPMPMDDQRVTPARP